MFHTVRLHQEEDLLQLLQGLTIGEKHFVLKRVEENNIYLFFIRTTGIELGVLLP